MRIRHLVCTDNFAGVERYVTTTATELARRGHDVEVLGGHPPAMREVLGDSPVTFVEAPRARPALRANLAHPRPDIVHTHMTAADLVAVTTKPFVRTPIVSTLHFAQPRGHDRITRRVYSLLPRIVDAQIAISRFVADTVGGESEVIVNGVPAPAGAPPSKGRDPVVLVAQRLETEKHTRSALEAFAESGLADQGWELHLAGEGSQHRELAQLADEVGIAASCVFLGRVGDLGTRMQKSAMLLATAPGEPFGLSVVEAMAVGLPVVAADGGAHRETIGSATPETLFAIDDAAGAGALVRRVADDPAWAADLGDRVRRRWAEAFTIEAHVDHLEAVYTRLANH